jgi:hypothetical protein
VSDPKDMFSQFESRFRPSIFSAVIFQK